MQPLKKLQKIAINVNTRTQKKIAINEQNRKITSTKKIIKQQNLNEYIRISLIKQQTSPSNHEELQWKIPPDNTLKKPYYWQLIPKNQSNNKPQKSAQYRPTKKLNLQLIKKIPKKQKANYEKT